MKLFSISILATALLLTACSNEPQPVTDVTESPAGANQAVVTEQPTSRPAPPVGGGTPSKLAGEVLETMNSGGYTYAFIDTGDASVWAAGPQTTVAVGDFVTASGLMAMNGFHSNTLDRDFEMIYFASALSGAATGAQQVDSVVKAKESSDSGISVAKADGGQTVEEIFTQKDKLIGTEVVIRAQVVKFNAQIMNTNWIHLQDGSGSEGTNDLTITTSATAAVGDVITVRGTLAADVDFGYGYKYALIIEGAEVTAE